jgi:hypothetical protein
MNYAERQHTTNAELRKLYKHCLNQYPRLTTHAKKQVMFYIKEAAKTQDVTTLDTIADKLKIYLRMPKTPFDSAWKREFDGYFGYNFCMRRVWSFLFDMVS